MDQNPPTLTETNHPATSFTKSSFTLAGSVGDTNALASLSHHGIQERRDGQPGDYRFAPPPFQALKTASYASQSLPLGGVVDGSYAYALTATDVAGKTTTVDSHRQHRHDASDASRLNAIPAWICSSAYTISGSATGPRSPAPRASRTIQYQLDGGAWTNAVWTDTSGGGNTSGTWNATLPP